MNTYGTRLGIIKQILDLGYKDLLERFENCVSDRSLRNYIENKTQMPGDMISRVPEIFPEIDVNWWHTGEGSVLKLPRPYKSIGETIGSVSDEEGLYKAGIEGEMVTIPASELFKAMFKDMTEVNRLLQSRLEYYEIFIKNINKLKI